MGMRYVAFRGYFELGKKAGLLKRKYPVNPSFQQYISLADWKRQSAVFFFDSRETINFPKTPTVALKDKIDKIRAGEFPFFNADFRQIGKDYNWLTNPDTGFKYNLNHWLAINDFSKEAGDIKFVWEKSRFSYINTIIRYDYHFDEDCAEWVFSEIDNWIAANPINCGPNYKCSQEISLRLLNWIFALNYYKHSTALTEARFDKIMHVCYWQLHHVRQNIHFSRIAVRNNHAITETMMLYLGGIFFPFFPSAKKWSKEGLKWLEEEIGYQIYEDGTFLQFSHNYHRVLIQLVTWVLYLSDLNQRKLPTVFLTRTQKSLQYLYQCQIEENGFLPNYGANDGALFFPMNDCEYRDYRPQLNALAYYFNREDLYEDGIWKEDRYWFACNEYKLSPRAKSVQLERKPIASFSSGGYFIQRDKETLTFIRCGKHKDRPSHADNLHLDIWYRGVNMLRDSGTYKYNTNLDLLNFFIGTKGHNTVMLGNHDQMEKGDRFIWLNWSQAIAAEFTASDDTILFKGAISAFQHLSKDIIHHRSWQKKRNENVWIIEDRVEHTLDLPMKQVWNMHPDFLSMFSIESIDEKGNSISMKKRKHWFSEKYGIKVLSMAAIFETKGKIIQTKIKLI